MMWIRENMHEDKNLMVALSKMKNDADESLWRREKNPWV